MFGQLHDLRLSYIKIYIVVVIKNLRRFLAYPTNPRFLFGYRISSYNKHIDLGRGLCSLPYHQGLAPIMLGNSMKYVSPISEIIL